MDSRNERVIIETERYRITGDLTLPRDGYRSRMTDFLNAAERDFIALTAVTLEPLDGGEEFDREFIAVSRRHVVLAMPLDDIAGGRLEFETRQRTESVAPPGPES
jgi:Family of unknown function (DUF6812)